MGAFDAALHPSECAGMEPMPRLLDLGEGQRVFTTSELARLERAKAIGNDSEKNFLSQAIDPVFIDRPVLKSDIDSNAAGRVTYNPIMMVGTAGSWLIHHSYC